MINPNKEPKFIALNRNDEVLHGYLFGPWDSEKGTERASEETMIGDWKKKHYIPNPHVDFADYEFDQGQLARDYSLSNSDFLNDRDFTVYTAPDDKYVFTVSREKGIVKIQFILDENSEVYTERRRVNPEWTRVIAIDPELKAIENAHAPIFAVSELPDMNTLSGDAYYLLSNESGITLHYFEAHRLHWIQIEAKLEPKKDPETDPENEEDKPSEIVPEFENGKNFGSNLVALFAAVEARKEDKISEILDVIGYQANNGVPDVSWEREYSWFQPESLADGFNTKITYKSKPACEKKNNRLSFHKLKASLDVFKEHCHLPDAVIADIKSLIDAHGARLVSHLEWMANKVAADLEGMLIHMKTILGNEGYHDACWQYSLASHFVDIIKWYAEHHNVDLAIFLQKALPPQAPLSFSDIQNHYFNHYIEATLYIKNLMIRDANVVPDKRAHLERLSELALELADATNDKEDLIYAMSVITELCGGNGFQPDLDVDRSKLYLNLLIKYASQVGKLKEENKALHETVAKLKNEEKTPNEPVGTMALVAAPRATSGSSALKLVDGDEEPEGVPAPARN